MLGFAANNKKKMVFMDTSINNMVEILKSDTDTYPLHFFFSISYQVWYTLIAKRDK